MKRNSCIISAALYHLSFVICHLAKRSSVICHLAKRLNVLYHLSIIIFPLAKRSFVIFPLGCLLAAACSGRLHDERRAQLDSLQAANQADTVFRSDSLQKILVDHFNRHGTPNEQMLANYLLGRAYADMGEAPKALQAYHDAAEYGNTTNYGLLNRIHQNAGMLYFKEYLPDLALEQWEKAAYNAKMDKDSFGMILCDEHRLRAYYQLGIKDSVISIARRCRDSFREKGLNKNAAYASSILCWYYIENNQLDSARRSLEELQGYIDFDKDNVERVGTFWNYCGTYYLQSGKVDSALVCYHRVLQKSGSWQMGEVLGYKGLFQAYKKMGISDSISKYAQLYSAANDSSNVFRSANQITQMQALYNYDRNLHLAERNQLQSESYKSYLYRLSLLLLLIVILFYFIVRTYKKKQQIQLAELQEVRIIYQKDCEEFHQKELELERIKVEQQKGLKEKENMINDLQENLDQLTKRMEASRNRLSELNAMKLDMDFYSGKMYKRFSFLMKHPNIHPSDEDWTMLGFELEKRIPTIRATLKEKYHLKTDDYRICLLICMNFEPRDIITLLEKDYDFVSKRRRYMLKRIFGEDGKPALFDEKLRLRYNL